MKEQGRVMFALIAISFLAFSAQAQKKFTHQDTLRGSLNPARMYDVTFYDLTLGVKIKDRAISGYNIISFTALNDLDSLQVDLFAVYKVRDIMIDGSLVNYSRTGNCLFLHPQSKIKKGEKRKITVLYEGVPPEASNPPWDGGFVWKKDSLNRDWVTVACEGMGASSWWPCKDYLGDEPDSMRIQVQVPAGNYCVSNGQLRNITDGKKGSKIFEWFVSYPINTYNVTLNIGNYDRSVHFYNRPDGSKLETDLYFLDYSMPKADTFFFGTAKRVEKMLEAMEYYFGPYPFPKDGYALVETPYWGMEHQSAVAYGNKFKLNSYGFDFILVHESGHEWWGNNISCKDHADMWLHEGFTTYSESLYLEYFDGPEKAQDYLNMQAKYIKNSEPMIGPMGVNYHDQPDNDIYYKGTWFLHTLRHVVQDDSLWFSVLKTFQQKYAGQTITTQDFEDHLEKLTGRNFKAIFDEYLHTDSLPAMRYSIKHKKHQLEVYYRWETKSKKFDLPMNVCILKYCLDIYPSQRRQKAIFRNISDPSESGFHFDHDDFLFREIRE